MTYLKGIKAMKMSLYLRNIFSCIIFNILQSKVEKKSV